MTLVECQNLISRTLICKSKQIVHKFVAKNTGYSKILSFLGMIIEMPYNIMQTNNNLRISPLF